MRYPRTRLQITADKLDIMSESVVDVTVADGKYRYVVNVDGVVAVYRHGEVWEARQADIVGDKFVYCLAAELQEARELVFDQGTELVYLRERVKELEGLADELGRSLG